jgi:hypothetical protein
MYAGFIGLFVCRWVSAFFPRLSRFFVCNVTELASAQPPLICPKYLCFWLSLKMLDRCTKASSVLGAQMTRGVRSDVTQWLTYGAHFPSIVPIRRWDSTSKHVSTAS